MVTTVAEAKTDAGRAAWSRHRGPVTGVVLIPGTRCAVTSAYDSAVGWFDLETGRVGEMTLSYVRKLQRWYFGLNFTYDKADSDYSISVSFWPEGVPEWTVGSRRFTGLGTSTGIRP